MNIRQPIQEIEYSFSRNTSKEEQSIKENLSMKIDCNQEENNISANDNLSEKKEIKESLLSCGINISCVSKTFFRFCAIEIFTEKF